MRFITPLRCILNHSKLPIILEKIGSGESKAFPTPDFLL